MKKLFKIVWVILFILFAGACTKEYQIEYQAEYPSRLAGNWLAFEFPGAGIEGTLHPPYDLVTSLDPNNQGYVILDKLYASDVRVRAGYSDTAIFVNMGEQLEKVSKNTYDIEYVSADGYVTENPVLLDFAYNLASQYYQNLTFYPEDISEILFLRAGFYDSYKAIVDTVLIIGYRKTGFEEVTYD